MEVSRRDFLRFSVAAGSATALSGLIGSGVNLGPVCGAGAGAANQRRQGHAQRLSLLFGGMRNAHSHGQRQIVNIEGDPRSPHNEGTLCPRARRSSSCTSIPTVRLRCCTAHPARPIGRCGISSAP